MKGKDQIEQLFSDKLGNFEAKVDPTMWKAVSSQVASQSGAAVTGMSILTKAIIGISAASVITVGAVLLSSNSDSSKVNNNLLADKTELINTKDVEESKTIVTTSSTTSSEIQTLIEEEVIESTLNPVLPSNYIEIEADELEAINDELLEEIVFEEEVVLEQEEVSKPELIIENTTDEIEVEAEEIVLYTIESLPNIFTPNGDGNNDVFKVDSKGLSDFNITILNNKNQVVYQSNDLNFEWRGLDFSQNNCSEGNYVYYITARDSAGNPVNKYSQLVLRR